MIACMDESRDLRSDAHLMVSPTFRSDISNNFMSHLEFHPQELRLATMALAVTVALGSLWCFLAYPAVKDELRD